MRRFKRGLRQSVTFCLLCMLIVLSINMTSLQVTAVEVTSDSESYDIAVVFDNSGSMYGATNLRWCRAKYAMEIFASMLDYSRGDTLTIFPMWGVTTDGTMADVGSYDSIEVTNIDDIDKISNLYTPNPSNTPFEPVTEAAEYLKLSSSSEKWLIVLTDGDFNQELRSSENGDINLETKIPALADGEINVEYLRFDATGDDDKNASIELESDPSNGFYARKVKDTDLEDALIEICNEIFSRVPLPEEALSGDALSLDLSMSKLIIFVQGEGAKIESLVAADGTEVPIAMDSGQRTYSTISAGGQTYSNSAYDTSLAGQVVTFNSCEQGNYTLNYSGAESDKIKIFYEPDVDLKVTLINSDGQELDPSVTEVSKGEYELKSILVDSITGADVTNHELLGGTVEIKNFVKYPGTSDYVECENGTKIELKSGESIDIYVEGMYVIGEDTYHLSTEGVGNSCFSVEEFKVAFEIACTVMQESEWYCMTEVDSWEPIKVDMLVDAKPLTTEQMEQTTLEVQSSSDLPYYYEMNADESAYYIYIGDEQSSDAIEMEVGVYDLEINATYVDEELNVNESNDNASFTIEKYPPWVVWLIRLIILLIILLLLLFYMSRKVLPRYMKKDGVNGLIFKWNGTPITGGSSVVYDRKGRTIKLKSANVPGHMEAMCTATFSLYPIDRRWTRSARRHFGISNISGAAGKVDKITIDGVHYKKSPKDGKFIITGGTPGEPINAKTYNPILRISTTNSTLDCKLIQRK